MKESRVWPLPGRVRTPGRDEPSIVAEDKQLKSQYGHLTANDLSSHQEIFFSWPMNYLRGNSPTVSLPGKNFSLAFYLKLAPSTETSQ